MRRPLYLGELLWKPREDDTRPEWREYRNFWPTTDAADGTHIRQSAGINPISRPRQRRRRPAVAIFITPAGEGHRLPWLDEVDTDAGFLRYFGDNKPESGKQAEAVAGNAALLDEMSLYGAEERATREQAAPLLFFENVGSAEGRPLTRFIGFGVIELAHRVTQLFKGHTFTNYAFDCVLFRGVDDVDGREALDFGWIDDRRDAGLTDVEANTAAPDSWQFWLETGATGLAHRRVRRFVIREDVLTYEDQVPTRDSRVGRVLEQVYERYEGQYKHGFQALASRVTELILSEPGLSYFEGWVTPVGPDGGVDFVQRLDIGSGFSSTRLVVLGQAKCRRPWPRATNGVTAEELARVVARLRRGWIGAYVTTSFYTEAAQREMIVDEYPILLVHGARLARAVEELRDIFGFRSVPELLDHIDQRYPHMVRAARPRPADILREWPGTGDLSDVMLVSDVPGVTETMAPESDRPK